MTQLHLWPDNFVLEEAKMHMKDGVQNWFCLHSREFTTRDKFQSAFKVLYIMEEDKIAKWEWIPCHAQKKARW